jgi:hypothetical protein
VEWSGHKTVLVEVPSHNPKSNDVEMSGMSSPASGATGGYGRLIDEDVGYHYLFRIELTGHRTRMIGGRSVTVATAIWVHHRLASGIGPIPHKNPHFKARGRRTIQTLQSTTLTLIQADHKILSWNQPS